MTAPTFSNIDVPAKQFDALIAELRTLYGDLASGADQARPEGRTHCLLIARDGRTVQTGLPGELRFGDKIAAAVRDLPADTRIAVIECVDVGRRLIAPSHEKMYVACEAIGDVLGDQIEFITLSARFSWDDSEVFGPGALRDFDLVAADEVFSDAEKLEILSTGLNGTVAALSPLAVQGRSEAADDILKGIIAGIAPELEIEPDQIDDVLALLPDILAPNSA